MLRNTVKVPDNCTVCAITICLVCMYDDAALDALFGKKMDSITPWEKDSNTSLGTYNVGVSLCIPSKILTEFDKIEFLNFCRDKFSNKHSIWKNKKIKNFDPVAISQDIFDVICDNCIQC